MADPGETYIKFLHNISLSDEARYGNATVIRALMGFGRGLHNFAAA